MFYAYILRSEPHPDRVYHGYTSDLRRPPLNPSHSLNFEADSPRNAC
jgi:hypothetical protein